MNVLTDGRGAVHIPLIVKGVNDSASDRHFVTESSGNLFNDACRCGAPVARPVPVRDDPLLPLAQQAVLKELYDCKDKLFFYRSSGNRDGANGIIQKVKWLAAEADAGCPLTIASLELDAVDVVVDAGEVDVGEEQVYEVDVLDLFSPTARRIGIGLTPLSGWSHND